MVALAVLLLAMDVVTTATVLVVEQVVETMAEEEEAMELDETVVIDVLPTAELLLLLLTLAQNSLVAGRTWSGVGCQPVAFRGG